MSRPSRVALGGVASALIAAGVVALPSPSASAASADVVIAEVYGGGGNSGATYKNDFIELRNNGSTPVDLTGWSVQYASAAGTSWQRTPLTGTIAPGARYLVQQAAGAGGTTDLPTPDATGSIAMSATSGKVALRTIDTALSGCGTSCRTAAGVKDFVGFGSSANEAEGSPTGTLSNTTSAARTGTFTDTDDNAADFAVGEPTPQSSSGGEEPPPSGIEGLTINEIQGAAHRSGYEGESVVDVPGVVTVVKNDGFWMQSLAEHDDEDDATSEGIFVFRPVTRPAVGDTVTVTGDVVEYRAGGTSSANLTLTEISGAPTVEVTGTAPVPTPTLVGSDRVPPSDVIDDDASGSVETSGSFDAAADGIDFWESMEGMLVGIEDARATGPTNGFGEIPVVAAGAEPTTARGGLYVSPDDFNPERVLLDDLLAPLPEVHTGDRLAGTTVGVLDYAFSNFKLLPWQTPTAVSGGLTRETTTAAEGHELAIASYNVENLSPKDSQAKFDALAGQIVGNLRAPDVVGLEEVQDNTGPTNDGVTAADETLRRLTEAIVRAGGPQYDWRQIDPVNNAEGGQPGGNIRVAFLYRSDRGVEFVDRGTPTSSTSA
ncbi:MAG TPA: lamin tail domain-containing protein, partial [Nocardioidaceae bacterium]|nr:lamin tail domain-containing protein [Nocardioidaceae bacterium]